MTGFAIGCCLIIVSALLDYHGHVIPSMPERVEHVRVMLTNCVAVH